MTEKVLQNKLDRFIARRLNIVDDNVVCCNKCNGMTLTVNKKDYSAYCPQCKENLFEQEIHKSILPERDKILDLMKRVVK